MLKSYVAQGGTLVCGCRTGYKDRHGHCVMEKLPGLLQELTGTDIPEYSLISPAVGEVAAEWDGTKIGTVVFNDILAPLPGAEAVGFYTENYYAGEPALIHNRYGKGETYYFGGAFTEETAVVFLEKLGVADPCREIVELPECCEITVRVKEDVRYLFVLNYSEQSQEILLKKPLTDMEDGCGKKGVQTLGGFEVKVYRMDLESRLS